MTSRDSEATALASNEEALVHEHLPLVHCMVNDLLRRVPAYIQRDDLMSAAMLGLVQAVRAYDPSREAKFSTFARARIQGALLDELRARDWASRGVRAKVRSMDAAAEALETTLGRAPTAEELSSKLGGTADMVHRLQADLHRATVLSLDGAPADGDGRSLIDLFAVHEDHADPAEILAGRELRAYLHDAVNKLPERLRHVVIGYFIEERSMSEIAAELGVTESRISHMRSEAVSLMGDAIRAASEEARESAAAAVEKQGVALRRRAAYCASVATASDYRTRVTYTRGWVQAPGTAVG